MDRLTIRRFRGLQDLTLNDLGRVNLLVGPNNTGKTSVLEAIAIFCQPLDLRVWLQATWRREVPYTGESFFLSVEWMFPHRPLVDGRFVQGCVNVAGDGRFPGTQAHAFYYPASRIRTKPTPSQLDSGGASQNGYEQSAAHGACGDHRAPNPAAPVALLALPRVTRAITAPVIDSAAVNPATGPYISSGMRQSRQLAALA